MRGKEGGHCAAGAGAGGHAAWGMGFFWGDDFLAKKNGALRARNLAYFLIKAG